MNIKQEEDWNVHIEGHNPLISSAPVCHTLGQVDKEDIIAAILGNSTTPASLSSSLPTAHHGGLINPGVHTVEPIPFASLDNTSGFSTLDLFLAPTSTPAPTSTDVGGGVVGSFSHCQLSRASSMSDFSQDSSSCFRGKDGRKLAELYQKRLNSSAAVPTGALTSDMNPQPVRRQSDCVISMGMNAMDIVPQLQKRSESISDIQNKAPLDELESKEELDRKEAKLERNRQCAREARQKKKEYIRTLECELDNATAINATLQKKYRSLQQTNDNLEEEVQALKLKLKPGKDKSLKVKKRKSK